ncbi:unnamed protein product [Schistocephalus solidus]|uniref:Uncharacterized protein n=1 Tax=Schistocephalus solidus TaxID=70667 RepID=A0A3P7CPD0_SCHSO|nr:unnamed protein product [Schistocephalus solidus]
MVPNSHRWLLEVGIFPAATPQATVTNGGLNQLRVYGVVCASTPDLSDSRNSHLPPLKKSYSGGRQPPRGECSCGRLYLVPNSHWWLLKVGFFPAATPQATVTNGGLNQVRVYGVVFASTPVQSLPFDVAVDVEDLLDPFPAEEPYTRLKDAVINRVAKSAKRMLRELFTQVELGDQTPSQLMRHMHSLLAGRHIDEPIFRKIWLNKLPLPMHQVLAMLDTNTSLEKLATHADRIMECYPSSAAFCSLQQTSVSTSRSYNVGTPAHQGTQKSERDPPYAALSSCCCAYRRAAPSSNLSQAINIARSS